MDAEEDDEWERADDAGCGCTGVKGVRFVVGVVGVVGTKILLSSKGGEKESAVAGWKR